MQLLDGKLISNKIKEEIREEVEALKKNGERPPHLAAILVGNDGASLTYVGSKVRSCEQIGFDSTLIKLDEDISEDLQPIGDYITGINYINFIDGFIYICNKNNVSWYCEYCNKKFNTKKGCLFHENVYCKKKNSNIIDCSSDNDYNLSDDEFQLNNVEKRRFKCSNM